MRQRLTTLLVIGLVGLCFYAPKNLYGDNVMQLTSPEFEANQMIPQKFTCQGQDVNPALNIEGIPEGTKSLALIMDDPDAPIGTWVHWVLFNMTPSDHIDENSVPGLQGLNSFGKRDWGGPCPPFGTHRYFFKLYALDALLELDEKIKKKDLEKAMESHILEQSELIGLYKKS